MMSSMASPTASTRTSDAKRTTRLSRQRVLEAALAIVDREGLEELSMRKLAAELGVEPMSLYKHVASKQDLLNGLADLIWAEVAADAPPDDDWSDWLRSFGQAIRDAIHRHPNALPALVTGDVSPPAGLQLFADQLERHDLDPPDHARAVNALRTVCAFALGTSVAEQCCFGPPSTRTHETERQRILRISRALPPDTPERLIDTALSVCDCDASKVFTDGLDLIIRGCDL